MTPYAVLLAGYLGVLALALAVEVAARAGREPFRPAAAVLDAALGSRAGRWLVLAAWVWVGFHFLAR